MLQDFVVLSNGVLQLALLDKLLRGAENFLFVEAKTKRHRVRTPAFFPSNTGDFRQRCRTGRTSPGIPWRKPQTAPRCSRTRNQGSRNSLIVRPGSVRPMVTNDYRGLPKGGVRPVPANSTAIFQNGSRIPG